MRVPSMPPMTATCSAAPLVPMVRLALAPLGCRFAIHLLEGLLSLGGLALVIEVVWPCTYAAKRWHEFCWPAHVLMVSSMAAHLNHNTTASPRVQWRKRRTALWTQVATRLPPPAPCRRLRTPLRLRRSLLWAPWTWRLSPPLDRVLVRLRARQAWRLMVASPHRAAALMRMRLGLRQRPPAAR